MKRYELLARGNDSTAVDVRPLDGVTNKFGKQTLQQLSAGEIIVKYNEVRSVLAEQRQRIEHLERQNAALREALQLLHDYQNGCPLPSYEKGWTRAMALTQEALKEHP